MTLVQAALDDGALDELHVRESRFGRWFLKTGVWRKHVLERALNDLARLLHTSHFVEPVVLDAGCGWGHSLALLNERFRPKRLIAVDIDADMLEASGKEAARLGVTVDLQRTANSHLMMADQSVDIILCHQTFHHLPDQEAALLEFHRVLKPNGILLFAESTKKYIHSLAIRLLFNHLMDVQRTADEYIQMIRRSGFHVDPAQISYPYLWWSRNDLGILERWFRIKPPADREETLINLIAVRPPNAA